MDELMLTEEQAGAKGLARQQGLEQEQQRKLQKLFDQDTQIIGQQYDRFVATMHPAYLCDTKQTILQQAYDNGNLLLEAFTFFRVDSCTLEDEEDVFAYLNQKMEKLYTALYGVGSPVVYGIVSHKGIANVVLGLLGQGENVQMLQSILEGVLNGVELQPYGLNLSDKKPGSKEVGLISAIPTTKIGEEPQQFSFAPLMKSLNGQDYMALVLSRPLAPQQILRNQEALTQIKDQCFAVSKRNLSHQTGFSWSMGNTKGENHATTNGYSTSNTAGFHFGGGGNSGGGIGKFGGINVSRSNSKSSSQTSGTSLSQTITDGINGTHGISAEVQNSYALELMSYTDMAMDRLRQGRSNGMWESVISYSADSKLVASILQACISGEFAKANPDLLPQAVHSFSLSAQEAQSNGLVIPKIFMEEPTPSPLCTAITSAELGLMCTLPHEAVPNFQLKKGKAYPMVTDNAVGIPIGNVCDGQRELPHMPFALSHRDLARHTFVCGITGSGKTTTVKGILRNADTPFLVIESAKKEYRNIALPQGKRPTIYTLGKPEINCIRMNPFYIPCGVSPQLHIDYLKDLFNASFSFYGPMPYILEKCLHNVYQKKGWNLTLGFHPLLMNTSNAADFFEAEEMQEKYEATAHKFLFPTMEELKQEVTRYIEQEMDYEGDIAGNIKTAIKARLESLCGGPKGYMFNTYEYAPMEQILTENSVFELEGLADDSDKAFCVGLLIIFINEYRQVTKEITTANGPLSHLLVIEEAHRLLKNVSTERGTEDMGNPKGKAVEHFTNMLAEMRSYGQGVIVAEQIPTKLAPDVIKNSSNKIIQRLVASDDQTTVANTIGLPAADSIHLGSLTTGTGLCHKEGMSLPVRVKIAMEEEFQVSDAMLYSGDITGRLYRINLHLAKETLAQHFDMWGLKLLNAILMQDYEEVAQSVKSYEKKAKSLLKQGNLPLVMCENISAILGELLTETLMSYLLHGVYQVKGMVSNQLETALKTLLTRPTSPKLETVKKLLKTAYGEDPAYHGKSIVAQLVYQMTTEQVDVLKTIQNHFFVLPLEDAVEIQNMRKGWV